MKVLSWDCAYKSLAWSYVDINTAIGDDLLCLTRDLLDMLKIDELTYIDTVKRGDLRSLICKDNILLPAICDIIIRLSRLINNFVVIHDIGVKDILGQKTVRDTGEIERTRALSAFITSFDHNDVALTIIEHQPPVIGKKTNTQSTVVSYQLAYHYIQFNPVFVDPKLKNNITLAPHLDFKLFLSRASTRYKNAKDAKYHARKEHSKANFLYFMETFGLTHLLKGISRTYLDDIADSFMQIFAYLWVSCRHV